MFAVSWNVTAYGQSVGPWPMFHHDAAHSGRSSYRGSDSGVLLWSYKTGSDISSSPSIDSLDRIYVGSNDKRIYALTVAGAFVWSYSTNGLIHYSSPALATDGRLYIGSYDFNLYALTSPGSMLWSYSTDGQVGCSPTLRSGRVFVGGGDKVMYSLTSAGSLLWSYSMGGAVGSSSAVSASLSSYVGSGSGDRNVYSFDSAGSLLWSYYTGSIIESAPALGTDGRIYMGDLSGRLCALESTPNLAWSYKISNNIGMSCPATGSDGKLFIGDNGPHNLSAIESDGSFAWSYQVGNDINSSPALGSDGMVYAGSWDNSIFALSSMGSLVWSYVTGDTVVSSPAIGSDGAVYVGSYDNTLYVFAGPPTVTPTATATSEPTSTPTETPTATPTPTPVIDLIPNKTTFAPTDRIEVAANVQPIPTRCYPFIRVLMPDGSTLYYERGRGFVNSPTPYLGFAAGAITVPQLIANYPALSEGFTGLALGTYIMEGGAVDATQTTSTNNLVYVDGIDRETLIVQ